MPPPLDIYRDLPSSTYFDLTSYGVTSVPLPANGQALGEFSFNVALVLGRANDPTPLLAADWASRQEQLATLSANGTLWSTYGARQELFDQALSALASLGIETFPVSPGAGAQQYVSSAASRTIWVTVDPSSFATLFGSGAVLKQGGPDPYGNPIVFWEGNLALPEALHDAGVVGVWFDDGALSVPILADPGHGTEVTLPEGPQSPGNSKPGSMLPNLVAADYYDFPGALGAAIPTGTIGLIEPGAGTALPGDPTGASFDRLLHEYQVFAGLDEAPFPDVVAVAAGGQRPPPATSDERALDVGIVATVAPNSRLILYAGSGHDNGAKSDAFTAYQSAFWDTDNDPEVVSSSFRSFGAVAPGSPFFIAAQELFVDAVLRNITAINASGDGGSSMEYANGLPNVTITHASAYSLVAGGASLSTVAAAQDDPTLNGGGATGSLFAQAMTGDRATLWQLMAGGLSVLPSLDDPSAQLVETAWNSYAVNGHTIGGYLDNRTGAGGVDWSQLPPGYQTAFGLALATADPAARPGRGIPDVAATSGGNMGYVVPTPDMQGTQGEGGTSSAAPLWAALASQIDAIFADQGLPRLGYFNDLLYIAATIAPASFNDVTLGNNTSSVAIGGATYVTPVPKGSPTPALDIEVTPTGYGYSAEPGYDLVTGLGTPNGTLLARALTWIAHAQQSFADSPDVLDPAGASGWKSPVEQTLLVQTNSQAAAWVSVLAGSTGTSFLSPAADPFAWTSRLAQQALQESFDPDLVRLFDGQTQGALVQQALSAGERLAVAIDAAAAGTPQASLSTPFGFVDFVAGTGAGADAATVHVARPVAVAETVGGLDDQTAIVRLRQGGTDAVTLQLYRVDDLAGTIDGLQPGAAGYAVAAESRAYRTATGATSIAGPGYGNYGQAEIADVDAGDLIAMRLDNGNHTYWAFAQANEQANGAAVGHLWNYGANSWGWEDLFGGGDRDFNDLVVQLDFTSAWGQGWLA